jgi:hypothetical protein
VATYPYLIDISCIQIKNLNITPGKPGSITDIHIPDTPTSGSDSERRHSNRKKSKFQRMLEKVRLYLCIYTYMCI